MLTILDLSGVLRGVATVACLFLFLLLAGPAAAPALARFGMILPSANQVDQKTPEIEITMAFLHPFEMSGVDLAWPKQALLYHDDVTEDLKGIMFETVFLEHQAWKLSYHPPSPGVYWFVMESSPYWEPAEDLFVIHYTKTAVAAYGGDQDWNRPLGLKTEIVPLLRPFGNYAGNSFSGTVLVDGSPASGAEVEVEHFNTEGWVAPSEMHITQVVSTGDDGTFSFTCPLPGWWAFSALTEADYTLEDPDGNDKPVKQGAVIWVYFDPNPFLAP